MNCPKCGSDIDEAASECSSCGMPTVFMGGGGREGADVEVLEPEVLESLDDVGRPGAPRPPGQIRPLGCTLGPGCGCIGLPLMALAGVVVSSVIALLWVLSLGRLSGTLVQLAARARRGFTRT